MAHREKTKYTGVYYRTSSTKRYDGKPDVCFDIAYKLEGKLIWEKVGWRSEGYTAVLASEIRGERIRKKRHPELFPEPRTQDLTYQQAWEIFKEKRLPSLKNRAARVNHYNTHIGPALGNMLLSEITTFQLESFKADLMITEAIHRARDGRTIPLGQSLAPATINLILIDVVNVMKRMVDWGFYSGPVPRLKLLPAENERQRFLTPKELDRLLDLLQNLSCRVYRIALLSAHTGMRLGEILQLRRQDLDFTNSFIHVDGKMGKRVAYMDDTVKTMLERIAPQQPSEFIFSNKGKPITQGGLRYTFAKAVSILGLNGGITDRRYKVVFHTLRHTFCSWLASKNVPLYTIGTLVGHKNTRSTQRYAKLSPDAKWEALKLIEQTATDHKS